MDQQVGYTIYILTWAELVRLNQRLAVDPFLGLKKSKLPFRTQVALYFQWPWTHPGVQMESHCYFHNSF
jgi:hypothetical protein